MCSAWRRCEVPYDSLIVAAGVNQSYFGHDEFSLYAPGMKTIDDALELRRRIFGAFEMAEMTPDPVEKERWLTVGIVGAGPTGVELAGQVRDLAVPQPAGRVPHLRPFLRPGHLARRRQRTPGHLRRKAVGQGRKSAPAPRHRAADGIARCR